MKQRTLLHNRAPPCIVARAGGGAHLQTTPANMQLHAPNPHSMASFSIILNGGGGRYGTAAAYAATVLSFPHYRILSPHSGTLRTW